MTGVYRVSATWPRMLEARSANLRASATPIVFDRISPSLIAGVSLHWSRYMSLKLMSHFASVMLVGGAMSLGAQQQAATQQQTPSANRLVAAVFNRSTAQNQIKLTSDQNRLAELESCKLDSCKKEAASLRAEIAQLSSGQAHAVRTSCTPSYICGGTPGYYIYAEIEDSCATQVTAEACPNSQTGDCTSASGTTSAYTPELSERSSGLCFFTWTVNGLTYSSGTVPQE